MRLLNYSASFQAPSVLLTSSLQTGPRVAYLYYRWSLLKFTLSATPLFIALYTKDYGNGAVIYRAATQVFSDTA